jgi:hypothetical protein
MADDIPAGWYRDATGTTRWWDGQKWTEHVQGATTTVMPATPAAPRTPAAQAEPDVPAYMRKPSGEIAGQARDDDHDDKARDASRRVWLTATFVGLLAFFLGMGIGGRGEPATPSPAPTPPTVIAEPGTDPDALDQMKKDLEERAKELDQREEDLNEREDNLASPTPTPTPDEDVSDDTIDDGTWEVGIDIPSGTYTTTGSRDDLDECTYTISNDEAGDTVVSADSSDDAMTVTLTDGQFFTSDNCETWQPRT